MPKLRVPSLPMWLTRLFDSPTTWSYAGLTLVLGVLVANVVFSSNTLPVLAKYLVMLATMGWLARLCDSATQRWAWLGTLSYLGGEYPRPLTAPTSYTFYPRSFY